MAEQWWRETWKEAIYRSDLRPNARLVALIHADFARDKRTSWVHLDDLMQRTGMSRSQALSWRGEVIKAGFLVVLQKSSPGRSPVFGLVIPEGNRSEIPDVNRSEIPDVSQATGPEIDPNGSGNPDEQVRDSGPHQSLINHSSISLSPEQVLVRDLLDLDDGDERVMKVPQLLTKHNPDSPKPWLRGCHKSGDLVDLLDDLVSGKEETGFAPEPDDDKFMDNPHYVEAHGNAKRVRVEDFYRHKIGDLGFLHFEIEDMLKETQRNASATTAKEVWEDVLQRAHRDVEEHPRCDECSVRIDEGHGQRCSQRKRHYCESCGAEVTMSHFSGLFPCPKCKRKHQPLQQTA